MQAHLLSNSDVFRVSRDTSSPPGADSIVKAYRAPAGAMHVLVVEDDPSVRQVCAEMAISSGCEVATADSVPAARLLIHERPVDLVFLDLRLPGGTGAALFEEIRARHPRALVVIMTAHATVSSAVELMRGGAADLLQKPFGLDQIGAVLERANQRRRYSEPGRVLRDKLKAGLGPGRFVGASPAMEKVFRIVSKVALTRHPVLLQGEPGTGKELIARAIHASSPEPTTPFVPVDCASLSPDLLESDLFGSAEAHPGSSRRKTGLLVSAGQGTVYLDEISHLQPPLQLKLLRALQDKQVTPAGAEGTVPLHSRVLASSSVDLQALVESGRFRRDLYYRLGVVNLRVPPLRERTGDVTLLAAHFLERQRRELDLAFSLSDEALRWMIEYHWPGNVRELENVIERACALASDPLLEFSDLSTQVQAYAHATEEQPSASEPASQDQPGVETMQANEKRVIVQALTTFHGDKIAAARALGIGKTTLYRKLKEYGLGDPAA